MSDNRFQVAKTDTEITSLTEELATPESQVAAQAVEHESTQANSIEKLAGSLQMVLAEMVKGAAVPTELVASTEAQMTNLLSDIRSISAAAQTQASNTAAASGTVPMPKREAPLQIPGAVPASARRKSPASRMRTRRPTRINRH